VTVAGPPLTKTGDDGVAPVNVHPETSPYAKENEVPSSTHVDVGPSCGMPSNQTCHTWPLKPLAANVT